MNTEPKQITSFKMLPIGGKFEFYRPSSGMAAGPWIKKTKRIYQRQSDGMRCVIGSIVEVVQPID